MLTIPEIRTSVENQHALIRDPHARKGQFLRDARGRLRSYSGGFSVVYPYTLNGEKWAFRCWHAELGNVRKRFDAISKAIQNAKLPYFCDFLYIDEGITINGKVYPTTRMRWVEGLTIKDYICKHKNSKTTLLNLADKFLSLAKDMHRNKFAHGDLQHGNIIVSDDGDLFLVDYDSFYCPALAGKEDIITGLKDYQHPARKYNKIISEKVDYFSELIIYLSILAIAHNPSLVDKYQVKDAEHMLFTSDDFADLTSSDVYSDIFDLGQEFAVYLKILEIYLSKKSIADLEPFDKLLTTLPKVAINTLDRPRKKTINASSVVSSPKREGSKTSTSSHKGEASSPKTPTSSPQSRQQTQTIYQPYSYPKRSLWTRMNDVVADIGDWFADNGENASTVVGAIAAVIVGIAVLVGDICIFVNAGIIWGILSLGLAATIGYYGCIIALAAGSIISRVLFFILRVLFYNLYVVLLWVLIPTGIIIYNAVENNSYTPSIVQTTSVQQTTTYYCTAQSGLNVRSTPSKSGKVVGKLKYGQAVKVLQEGASFCKIKFTHSGGETAWVGSQYISKTKPAMTTTNTTKKTSNTSSKATTTTTSKSKTSSNSTTSTTKATTSNSTSTSKLLVDSKTYLIYKLSSNSGQRIFSVSTSESDYQIISKPAWCSILKKEKGYFEIKYEANSQKVERSGTIKLKAGDATASIVLEQRVGTDNTTSQTTSSSSASKTSASSSQSTAPAKGMHNGYEYVDLGLSVKWATSNMYGHYRFGEKTPRPTKVGNTDSYRGSTYSLSNDVARTNWGGNWRLPTKSEFEELINKCKWTATTQGGVKGLKVTGPSGNSIFLPAAGYRHESSNDLMSRNEVGYYWSSTSYGGGRVWTLNIWCGGSSSNQKMAGAYGSFGNCIRPVCR